MDADKRLVGIIDEIRALKGRDKERDHCDADDLLCEALRLLGGGDVADAYEAACERVGFWYA